QIEVLNASANSWNPRNELAYLRRFGLFNSDVLVLLINTDDLFGTPPTSLGVGRSRNYPQVKPLLALTEVLSKFQSNPVIPELRQIQQEGGDRVGKNLAAIRAIKQLTTQANTSFILALTPLRREIEPGSKDYEIKARNRLKEFTLREQISYLDFLPLFAKFQPIESLYRDHIHLSPQGNQLVVKQISQMLATKSEK
ncbi:MAG: SGNH/GDSL hydrolase family protein, partial [Cyanobacteria bacterium J083]